MVAVPAAAHPAAPGHGGNRNRNFRQRDAIAIGLRVKSTSASVRGGFHGGNMKIIQALACTILSLFGSSSTANADWEVKTTKDPFDKSTKAEMISESEGWALAMSFGCSTHDYLSLTFMTLQAWPTDAVRDTIPTAIDVIVDDTKFMAIAGEAYHTSGGKVGVRTSKASTDEARRIIEAVKTAKSEIGVRTSVMNSVAQASMDGSTRAAEVVLSKCK